MSAEYKQDRSDLAKEFLNSTDWRNATREHLSGDSSRRSYERLHLNGKSAVLMNAPLAEFNEICTPTMTPAERENLGMIATRRLAGTRVDAFVCMTRYLQSLGLRVPDIYAFDVATGFAVLEDLGDTQYWELLEKDSSNERAMYEAAVDVLVVKDVVTPPDVLRYDGCEWPLLSYDTVARNHDAIWFLEWYVAKYMNLQVTREMHDDYLAALAVMYGHLDTGHQGLILRDYHSPNLLWLSQNSGAQRACLVDYQDALVSHPSQDLMFLFCDVRRDVTPDLIAPLYKRYIDATGFDADAVDAAYAVHRVINNARLTSFPLRMKYQNNLPHYMKFMPRIIHHFEEGLKHPACAPLAEWFKTYLPQGLKEAA